MVGESNRIDMSKSTNMVNFLSYMALRMVAGGRKAEKSSS
jgi:hypothetical protein